LSRSDGSVGFGLRGFIIYPIPNVYA
jgi:hypothetical protein